MSARRTRAATVLAVVATVTSLCLSTTGPASAAGSWTVVDLGSLGGASGARAISPNGEWIAGWSYTSTGEQRAVRWHRVAGKYAMQALSAPHASVGEAFDVTDTGIVVGWLSGCGPTCEQAALWNASGALTVLPGDGGALWVSSDATLVAGRRGPTGATWTLGANGWTDHPVDGGGEIYDVDERVAVGHARNGGSSVPATWTLPATTPQPLPLPSGTTYGSAFGADAGVVVGVAGSRPVRWVDRRVEVLPTGGGKGRTPSGRADDVLGGAVVGDAGGRAVRWSPDGSYVQLDTLLPRRSGWTLRRAQGISVDGSIVGEGSRGAGSRAFLLVPPAG